MMTGLVERHPLKEKRRANKPLLERKRRAKINDSLTDLKHLVLSSLNKDVSKYAKMEKVDILDMTVRFLKGRCLDQHQDDCTSMYRAGYRECTKQMYQNIMTMDGLDHAMKCRILSNLSNCQRDESKLTPPPSPTFSDLTLPDSPASFPASPHKLYTEPALRPGQYLSNPPPPLSSQHNNNSRLFVKNYQQEQTSVLPPLIHKPIPQTSLPPLHAMPTTKRTSSLWRPW